MQPSNFRGVILEGSSILWHVGDIGLNILHSGLILFVMLAWIPSKTRRAHLIALFLVLFSWIALGYWYGFGYCVLTDWHWAIKKHLGETDLPTSFIGYVVQKLFGTALSDAAVAWIAYGVLVVSLVMSVVLNIRDTIKGRTTNPN